MGVLARAHAVLPSGHPCIFGESHGAGIGVVIDGFPSGVMYDEAFVLREMERRAPGRNKQSTARKEADRPEIQSGIYNGKTTGTPICAVIRNTNQRSGDCCAPFRRFARQSCRFSPFRCG